MGQVKSLLRTATSTKDNFTTVYCMEKASSYGAMVSNTKVNLQITELPVMVYIVGQTEVFMKVK